MNIVGVPRDPDAPVRTRRALDRLAAWMNELARRGNLTFNGAGNVGIALNDSDIPADITRDTELAAAIAGVAHPIFDHFADVSTTSTGGTEDDLYSDTVATGRLAADGEKLEAWYSGVTVSHATALRRIRAYFGGTLVYDSTAQATTSTANWSLGVRVIRESSSVVRVDASFDDNLNLATFPGSQYTRITGLTLANTQVLKITGTASGVGAASGDITAKLGCVKWLPVAS